MTPPVRQSIPLPIASLEAGFPGITPAWGRSLAEAASVCLEAQGHTSPKLMEVVGEIACEHDLNWLETDDQMRRTWGDLEEAAEHGAYGIAALLIARHTGYEVVERSKKGTGFDYWLGAKGQDGQLFQGVARLEVSAIQRGGESARRARLAQKLTQTERSDGVLPAFVVVVEYATPVSQVAAK